MKIKFKKRGMLNDHYIVVEYCCVHYNHVKELLWNRKNSVFFFIMHLGTSVLTM